MATSLNNTHVGFTLTAVGWEGVYDDTSGYSVVKIWATTPGECTLMVYYAATDAPAQDGTPESYTLFGNNTYVVNSQTKMRYVKVALSNNTAVDQANVVIRTKFVAQASHPFLTHVSDNITSNITVDLANAVINQNINHQNANIQMYGTSTDANVVADHRAIRTDNSGCIQITGSVANGSQRNPNPVVIGGRDDDGNVRTVLTDTTGKTFITSGLNILDQVGPTEPVFPIGGRFTDFNGDQFASMLKTDVDGRLEVKLCTDEGTVGDIIGPLGGVRKTVTMPVGISIGDNADGTPVLAGTFGNVNAIPVTQVGNFGLDDTNGLRVKPLATGTVFQVQQKAGTSFKVNDTAGINVKPFTDTIFTVKPDTNARFQLKDDNGGIKVNPTGTFSVTPATGASFLVNDTAGVQVKPLANAKFSVAPATGASFGVNDTDGVKVQPLANDTLFTVTPDTNASFKVNDAGGLKVKPIDAGVFTVNPTAAAVFNVNDTAGINIKPFNTTTTFTVTPATGAKFPVNDIKVAPLAAGTQFPVKFATSSVFNSSKGYDGTAGSFVRIGAGNVKTIYSINICNMVADLYVKFYNVANPVVDDQEPANDTQTQTQPFMMHFTQFNSSRDIPLPRGITVNGPLYVLVSSTPINELSQEIPDNNVYVTVTWD